MVVALEIAIFLIATAIIFQDLKQRSIHILLLLVFCLSGVLYSYFTFNNLYISILWNSLFIFLLITIAYLIAFIRHRVSINQFFHVYLGLGDLLIWMAFATFFDFLGFLIFMSASFLASAILHLLLNLSATSNNKLIPLAGYQAIFFMLLFVHTLFFTNASLYHYTLNIIPII